MTTLSPRPQFASIVEEFSASERNGREILPHDRVAAIRRLAESGGLHTAEPLLPLLLSLKGKPYTLADHFPFAQLFNAHLPKKSVYKTGRQVSKSTGMASSGIIRTTSIPHFTTLYVTPLYEQVRRFSANFVRPFIEQSPVKTLWTGTDTENSVLQRSFKNRSKMIFSFALLDADRVRGVQADAAGLDEIQDMDRDHIPIILETMSYSPYEIVSYTGTPKTFDNTLEVLWGQSSQAEWFIPCRACNHWNIPAMEFHLDKMIGPMRDDISEHEPALICYKCRRPVNPRTGRWRHRYPDRMQDFAGYHVPQVIMPIHCMRKDKWSALLAKREGFGNVTTNVFYNEVLGESYDVSQKIVSLSELKAAMVLPWKNEPEPRKALQAAAGYVNRVLAVDWGGGGADGISLTAIAVLGFRSDGKIDVLWGKRLLTPHAHMDEARECLRWFKYFRCSKFVHDYTGAGTVRETVMIQAGMPEEISMPIAYVRSASAGILNFVERTAYHPRDHYRVDKTRSLLYTCTAIKLGILRFFEDDYRSPEHPGLVRDFLALVENKVESRQSSDLYMITRGTGMPDDFAQAVNIGCAALWHMNQAWPNFANTAKMRLTQDQVYAAGSRDYGWETDRQLFGSPDEF